LFEVLPPGGKMSHIFYHQTTWTFYRYSSSSSQFVPIRKSIASFGVSNPPFETKMQLEKTDNGYVWVDNTTINSCDQACKTSLSETFDWMNNPERGGFDMAKTSREGFFTKDFTNILLNIRKKGGDREQIGKIAKNILGRIKDTLHHHHLQGWQSGVWTRDAFCKIALPFPELANNPEEIAHLLGRDNVIFNLVYPHFYHFLKQDNNRKTLASAADARNCIMRGECSKKSN